MHCYERMFRNIHAVATSKVEDVEIMLFSINFFPVPIFYRYLRIEYLTIDGDRDATCSVPVLNVRGPCIKSNRGADAVDIACAFRPKYSNGLSRARLRGVHRNAMQAA